MSGFSRYAMKAAAARAEGELPPMRFLDGPKYDPPPSRSTWGTVARSWKKAAKVWGRVERMLR